MRRLMIVAALLVVGLSFIPPASATVVYQCPTKYGSSTQPDQFGIQRVPAGQPQIFTALLQTGSCDTLDLHVNLLFDPTGLAIGQVQVLDQDGQSRGMCPVNNTKGIVKCRPGFFQDSTTPGGVPHTLTFVFTVTAQVGGPYVLNFKAHDPANTYLPTKWDWDIIGT